MTCVRQKIHAQSFPSKKDWGPKRRRRNWKRRRNTIRGRLVFSRKNFSRFRGKVLLTKTIKWRGIILKRRESRLRPLAMLNTQASKKLKTWVWTRIVCRLKTYKWSTGRPLNVAPKSISTRRSPQRKDHCWRIQREIILPRSLRTKKGWVKDEGVRLIDSQELTR